MIAERCGREHWDLVGKVEKMFVAANEDSAFRRGESDQIIVSRIRRSGGRRASRVADDRPSLAQPSHHPDGIIFGDTAPQLRMGERAPEVGEKSGGRDQFEIAPLPRA